jgi:hypothetical protein
MVGDEMSDLRRLSVKSLGAQSPFSVGLVAMPFLSVIPTTEALAAQRLITVSRAMHASGHPDTAFANSLNADAWAIRVTSIPPRTMQIRQSGGAHRGSRFAG